MTTHPVRAGAQIVNQSDARSEVVARLRVGDESAFGHVFDTYYVSLCVYVARQVGTRAVAEEIVQDVFANLWAQRAALYLRGDIRTYLFGAARNRAWNHLRDQRVVTRWEDSAARDRVATGMSEGPHAVDELVRRGDLRDAFERALAGLSHREREAFTLRRRGNLSTADIAQVMGISAKTVEGTLTRAYKALREQLADFF